MKACPQCNSSLSEGDKFCHECGRQLDSDASVSADPSASRLPPDVKEKIIRLLRNGKKLKAVKVYRNHTGVQLLQAKQEVEALATTHGVELTAANADGALVFFAGVAVVFSALFCLIIAGFLGLLGLLVGG